MRTIYVTPWRVPGWLIVVGVSGIVPRHVVMIVVPGCVPRCCSIAVRAGGINKANLVRGDEEVREDDWGGGCVNRIPIGLRYENPADLSIIVVASAYIPKVGEVIKAMGDGLELRYAMSAELFIESEIVGNLPDMKGAGECLGCCRVTD